MRTQAPAVSALVVSVSKQLGDVETSFVASWLGSRQAVVLRCIGVLAVCASSVRLFPVLFRRDRLQTMR